MVRMGTSRDGACPHPDDPVVPQVSGCMGVNVSSESSNPGPAYLYGVGVYGYAAASGEYLGTEAGGNTAVYAYPGQAPAASYPAPG